MSQRSNNFNNYVCRLEKATRVLYERVKFLSTVNDGDNGATAKMAIQEFERAAPVYFVEYVVSQEENPNVE